MFLLVFRFVFINLVFILTTISSQAFELKENATGLELNMGDDNQITLLAKSEGVRHKKIALFNINVYQARLFVPQKKFKLTQSKALLEVFPKAIKINPMRSFSGDKLKEAVLVSYEVNKVDATAKSQLEFLELISKHKIQKNNPVYLVGVNIGDKEELHLIMTNMNEVIQGHKGFVNEVFSVWLGQPVDSDMAKLQDTIIN